MRYSTYITATLLLSLLLGMTPAQQNDEDVLSIPPRLTVSQRKTLKDSGCTGICVREFSSVQQRTLLPVLFFDHPGSAVLTNRYQQFTHPSQADTYCDADFVWAWEGELAKYWQMLNIVGFRMRAQPQATIAIEGWYSTQPGESPEVGMRRAASIRDYLTRIWKIDEGRIKLRQPKQGCDSSDHSFLQEEARRVVIYSDSDELFNVLMYKKKYLSMMPLDLTIDIAPLLPSDRVAEVTVTVWVGDSLFTRERIVGAPDVQHYRIWGIWDLHPQIIQVTGGPIRIAGRVKTIDGAYHSTNTVSIPIEVDRKEESALSNTRLLIPCFPFMGATLHNFHAALIDNYVRENANDGSVIRILGISDPAELPESREEWLRSGDWRRFNLPHSNPWRTWSNALRTTAVEAESGVKEYLSTCHNPEWCATFGVIPTDSLMAIRRAESVAEHIAQTFSGTRVEVDADPSTIIENFALPEERWYGRGVYLAVERATEDSESP